MGAQAQRVGPSLADAGPLTKLECVRDSWWSRDYDFLLDQAPCGSLEWERGWRAQAVGETGGRAWWIRRPGWFGTDVEIGPSGSEHRIAVFRRNFYSPDEITFTDGRLFHWRRPRGFVLSMEWIMECEGAELLSFTSTWSMLRPKVRIEIPATRGLSADDLPILVFLGTYLFLQRLVSHGSA